MSISSTENRISRNFVVDRLSDAAADFSVISGTLDFFEQQSLLQTFRPADESFCERSIKADGRKSLRQGYAITSQDGLITFLLPVLHHVWAQEGGLNGLGENGIRGHPSSHLHYWPQNHRTFKTKKSVYNRVASVVGRERSWSAKTFLTGQSSPNAAFQQRFFFLWSCDETGDYRFFRKGNRNVLQLEDTKIATEHVAKGLPYRVWQEKWTKVSLVGIC